MRAEELVVLLAELFVLPEALLRVGVLRKHLRVLLLELHELSADRCVICALLLVLASDRAVLVFDLSELGLHNTVLERGIAQLLQFVT